MTEFVVGTVLFLLPLFLIVPMLGKYSDVKASAAPYQTVRYVAWERTVWYGGASSSNSQPGNSKSETEIQNEARQRVVAFGKTLGKDDKSASGYTTTGGRYLWRNRDGSTMLKNYGDASVGSIPNDASPDTVTGTILDPITSITGILGFKLETKGLYTGNAALKVTTLPIGASLGGGPTGGAFNPGDLTFVDKNVILANGWGANGKAHVRSMTAGIAPLGLVDDASLGNVVQIAGCIVMALFAPEICMLEIGKIEPDVVPPDRLTP